MQHCCAVHLIFLKCILLKCVSNWKLSYKDITHGMYSVASLVLPFSFLANNSVRFNLNISVTFTNNIKLFCTCMKTLLQLERRAPRSDGEILSLYLNTYLNMYGQNSTCSGEQRCSIVLESTSYRKMFVISLLFPENLQNCPTAACYMFTYYKMT